MTTVLSYKLRAGAPQPAGNFVANREFVIQAFGAEINESTICEDREQLKVSDDMQGLGGDYYSINYRGKDLVTINNINVFDAEETLTPVFVDEDNIPGINVFAP